VTEQQISDREIKALQIAAKSKLTQKGNVWLVPSQAGHGEYHKRRAVPVQTSSFAMRSASMCSQLNTRLCARLPQMVKPLLLKQ
jgi:hypothetical protein